MRNFKKTLAVVLAVIMLVSAMPLSVFAAETGTTAASGDETATSSEQYYYKYTFDERTTGSFSAGLSNLGNTSFSSNPLSLLHDGTLVGEIAETGDNKYLKVKYLHNKTNGNGAWRGIRFGLYDKANDVDLFTANAISISFDFRWTGMDETEGNPTSSLNNLPFFRIRRLDKSGTNKQIELIWANVDSNGNLVLSAKTAVSTNSTNIYTFDKNSTDFSKVEIKYYDMTATYSLIIDGTPIVESAVAYLWESSAVDLRGSNYVDQEYDNDLIATKRQPYTTGTDVASRSAVELLRVDLSASAVYNYTFDFDNFVVKQDTVDDTDRVYYYKNTFTSTLYNGFSKVSNNFTYVFKGENDISFNDGYFSIGASTRLDLKDTYQFLQDGNWTASMDLQITNTASRSQTIFTFHDGILTLQFLSVDSNGYLYLNDNKIPGVTIPKVGDTNADGTLKFANVKVSCVLTNDYKGVFPDFIDKSNVRKYAFAVYVDDELVGAYCYTNPARTEVSGSNLINTVSYTKETLDAELSEEELEGLTLVEELSNRKTYKDADGVIYQMKYADGSFVSGVKVTLGSYGAVYDVLGILRNDVSTVTANIDNFEIYSGIGTPALANGKDDTKGVINYVNFAKLNTTNSPSASGGTSPAYGGANGIILSSNYNSTKITNYTDYVTLQSSSDVYFDLHADYSGGKVFATELTLRNVTATSSTTTGMFNLMKLRRQTATEKSGPAYELLNYDIDAGCVYFTMNSTKYYLLDADGNRVTLKDADNWTTLRAVVDETGDRSIVFFYVNGELAKYETQGMAFEASNLSGILSAACYDRKDAVDQRVRVFQTMGKATMDIKEAKIEYATAVESTQWADSASVDFSKITNLSELGDQFVYSDGCYINENGALVVPTGGYFGWIDYNGTFAHFLNSNAKDENSEYRVNVGYNFEAKMKSSITAETTLFTLTYASQKDNGFVFVKDGCLKMGGNKVAGYKINDLTSGKYSEISVTWVLDDNNKTVFADGKMVGIVGNSVVISLSDYEPVVFKVAGGTEIAELYIHADQARTLALNGGNIFELDPDAFLPKDNNRYPGMGIWEAASFYGNSTRETDETVGNYYSFDFVKDDTEKTGDHANAKVLNGQQYSDVYLTDYLENKVTVFEYDIRFTKHAVATGENTFRLLGLRRTDDGSTSWTNIMEDILFITDDGRLKIYNGRYLCDKDGNDLVLTDNEWVNIAVIYDTLAGHVSYVVDGKIYDYHKSGEASLGLAYNIQLDPKDGRLLYRTDAADTKARIMDVYKGFCGKLDIAGIKIYNTDSTANAGFIGAQKDTTDRNIRLVAGVDMLYYGKVGFSVKALDNNGTVLGEEKLYTTNSVYSSIEGGGKTLYPENYGYRYFYTATVNGITDKNAVKLEVTPFTEINGVRYDAAAVMLDIDFTGENMNSWTLDYSNSKDVKLVGTNTSSDANFSATDIVSYTNTGALEFNGLDAKFAFTAYVRKGGSVSINLVNAKGEVATSSKLDVYVNGTYVKTEELAFGHHTLELGTGYEAGEYEFMIVKRTGGDFISINHVSVDGYLTNTPPELAVENALIVKVSNPASGNKYGNVNAYVQTSDASGNYYIKYQFNYSKTSTNSYNYFNGVANTADNRDMYRIESAYLVEKKSDGSFETKYAVLNNGEISLAIKESHQFTFADSEKNYEDATTLAEKINASDTVAAKDYVGGFHGDENIQNDDIAFYLDGVQLDTTKSGTYTATHLEFKQGTVINRCDEENQPVMKHNQYYLLDTNGMRLSQQVEFLTNDFYPLAGETFLQMFTFYRVNTSLDVEDRKVYDNYICADVVLLDAAGNTLLTEDLRQSTYDHAPSTATINVTVGDAYKTQSRYAEYLGNNNGLYGKAGFVISDASVKSDSARLAIRKSQGDNKWYASFDTLNGAAPYKGEVWNVNDYYYIDYNTANITPTNTAE